MNDYVIREQIIEVGRHMYEKGFVAANDGNISVRAADGGIWITPTGLSKGELTRDKLLKISPDGSIMEGFTRPSSESAMHLRLYAENSGINAVVHTHASHATAFAIAGIPLNVPCYPEALVLLGEVPVAPYAQPGTQEVPDSVAPYAKTHRALLLEKHGALSWGNDLTEAWYRMESLENYAKIYMMVKYVLKSDVTLTGEQIKKLTGEK